MGETRNQAFHFSFCSSLKVDFQGSEVTSDAGLLLVRELDERLGLGQLIDKNPDRRPPRQEHATARIQLVAPVHL